MKKTFEFIGLITLICFSFFMTEQTVSVMKNQDDIMIEIKSNYKKYENKAENAIIKDNTIISGINGHKVNINKSYKAMKEYGKYNDELYVFDEIKPKISIQDNKDKVIINGHKTIRKVSLIFILNTEDTLDNIIDILSRNQVTANIFINNNWLINHNNNVVELIDNHYNIGINDNVDYQDSELSWMNTVIRHVGKQKDGYCMYKGDKDIKFCNQLDMYTIKPLVLNKKYFLSVKENLNNGLMIAFAPSNTLYEELDSIIKYIKSKGYKIVNLDNLLK